MNATIIGSRAAAPRSTARAEVVGSLLRPKAIMDGISQLYSGKSAMLRRLALANEAPKIQALTKATDVEIQRLVRRQIEAGLDVVTDGELRRASFLSSFYDAVDGFGAPEGTVYGADPGVTGRLRKSSSPLIEEATFMRSVTDFPFKVTIPAPSYFYTDFVAIPGGAYDSRQQLVNDVVEIERLLVAEAIAAGANWIQFDFPLYPALVDDAYAAKILKATGFANRDALLAAALHADSEVTRAIPEQVTVGLHLCRGNMADGFWSGSLAPIAERIFNELPHDRFLFEWEDIHREGDYEPIKYVPKDRIMAMGLVSTKTTRVETLDDLVRRLEAASKYLDMSQLALCTQCGFASVWRDHLVQHEEVQWRKLEVIGRVADHLWPKG